MSNIIRTDLETSLHRLANLLETQLANLLPQLLAESRTEAASDLVYRGCNLVTSLREIRDGKEGGEV
jgi:hypothetical protein